MESNINIIKPHPIQPIKNTLVLPYLVKIKFKFKFKFTLKFK